MSKKGPRQIVFVCAGISNTGELLTKIIPAVTPAEANDLFVEQFSISPKEVLGPFFKKRTQILETTRELKFTNEIKRATYEGWIVNAFFLKEPEDQAYLVFLKRIDGKKIAAPKGTITVPIADLSFI